jgi:hypothetical protein
VLIATILSFIRTTVARVSNVIVAARGGSGGDDCDSLPEPIPVAVVDEEPILSLKIILHYEGINEQINSYLSRGDQLVLLYTQDNVNATRTIVEYQCQVIEALNRDKQRLEEQCQDISKKYGQSLSPCANNKCNQREENGLKYDTCASCCIIKYCDKSCQRAHWREEHKRLCRRTHESRPHQRVRDRSHPQMVD